MRRSVHIHADPGVTHGEHHKAPSGGDRVFVGVRIIEFHIGGFNGEFVACRHGRRSGDLLSRSAAFGQLPEMGRGLTKQALATRLGPQLERTDILPVFGHGQDGHGTSEWWLEAPLQCCASARGCQGNTFAVCQGSSLPQFSDLPDCAHYPAPSKLHSNGKL